MKVICLPWRCSQPGDRGWEDGGLRQLSHKPGRDWGLTVPGKKRGSVNAAWNGANHFTEMTFHVEFRTRLGQG